MTPANTTPLLAKPQAGVVLPAAQCIAIALGLSLVAGILQMGSAPYIAFAFMSALILHLATKPSVQELAAVAACGAFFGGVYLLGGGGLPSYPASWLATPGGLLGMGSVEVLMAKWIFAPPGQRAERLKVARDAGLVAALCVITMLAVSVAVFLTPLTFDRLLMAADMKFGVLPGWIVGRWFHKSDLFFNICAYAYNSLPLGIGVCLAWEWRRRKNGNPPEMDLRWQAMVLGVMGFGLYQICPAAGPVYLMGKAFPLEPVNLTGMDLVAAPMQMVARNAMPSLHVGWTLLLFWSTRHRGALARTAALLYLSLTILATLGTGEHYLVDLMLAPPVALITFAICCPGKNFRHWLALGVCAPLTLVWLIAFRTGAALAIPAGFWMWTLFAVTVLLPIGFYLSLPRTRWSGL
jgi:hypothetical protein